MLVAIPNNQGRVSPVLDVAARLLLVRFDAGVETSREEVILIDHEPEKLVAMIGGLGVKTLICGAISLPLEDFFRAAGVRVIARICGEVEKVAAAFVDGSLGQPEFMMPGCCCSRRRQACRKSRAAKRFAKA